MYLKTGSFRLKCGTLKGLFALWFCCVAIALCSACGQDGPAPISFVVVSPDGLTLTVNLETCNADKIRTDVEEGPEEVIISITVEGADRNNDCADLTDVGLTRPLGDRRVVDGTTGEPTRAAVAD